MELSKKVFVPFAVLLLAAAVSAIIVYGTGIFSSSFALNPENVLDADSDYAVLQFGDGNLSCPVEFDHNGAACSHDGKTIRGWLIVDFNSASGGIQHPKQVEIFQGNYRLGCSGSDCNQWTSFLVFAAQDLGNRLNWVFKGACSAGPDTNSVCIQSLTDLNSLDGILVGRSDYPNSYPDPAIHWIRVDTNSSK